MSPTYNELEVSRDSGAPVELFEFMSGSLVWRLTSADESFTYASQTYPPGPVARTRQEYSREATAGSIAVTLPKDHEIAILLRDDGLTTPLYLTIFRLHRGNTSDVVQVFPGEVESFHSGPNNVTLTCVPASAAFERRIPSMLWTRQCQLQTYSARCGLDKDDWKTTATISAVAGRVISSADFGALDDQWFRLGWVKLASGDRRQVEDHVGNDLKLTHPFPVLAPGAVVDAYAGDDKRYATCRDKFSNRLRFMGWKDLPTRNQYRGSIV